MNRLTVTGTKFLTPMQASKEQLLEEIKRHQKYYDRLVAYEDTGFEPEQVKQLNDAFKNSQKKLEKAFDDLLAYKDLEEQGLLIKLPCKVGDIVYFVTQELDVVKGSCKKVIDEFIITEIRGNKYNPLWFMASSERCIHRDFHPTQIGKTVFLTREEAEKALEDK